MNRRNFSYEEKPGKNLIFFIIILIPVIIAALFLFNAKRNSDLKKETEKQKQLLIEGQAEKEKQAQRGAEEKIREHWRKTAEEANDLVGHGNFAGAIEKMKALKEVITEPAFVRKTETCIQNIIKLRERAVKELMNRLTGEANAGIAEGDIKKAVAVYKNYSGKLAEETREERKKFVMKLSEYQNAQVKNN